LQGATLEFARNGEVLDHAPSYHRQRAAAGVPADAFAPYGGFV
jgi:hypothetical protein